MVSEQRSILVDKSVFAPANKTDLRSCSGWEHRSKFEYLKGMETYFFITEENLWFQITREPLV
jgi:hypothetical protein